VREELTYPSEQMVDMGAIIVPSHELQNLLTRMLEWDIEVGEKVPEPRESLEMTECEGVRIEVKHSISNAGSDMIFFIYLTLCIDRFEELYE
jgi:hypothetical protein